MLPQFYADYFKSIPPPDHSQRPFRVVCAARIERNKGVFDLLETAAVVERKQPGTVVWDVCGTGSALSALTSERDQRQLGGVVNIRGWVPPPDMKTLLGASHICVVPTRSDFAEGMAHTAIEGILSGRPVVTSAVVPALEVLRLACLEAEADNPAHYAECVLRLLSDSTLYRQLAQQTQALSAQFFDRNKGFAAALTSALLPND